MTKKQHAVSVTRVVERHDVGMSQSCGDRDLAKETFSAE
jgi:hypothetical protein